ncbi:MAG: hypothetical protein RIR69_883 [Actinomycetota bacterium]|jgi:hypothetical protein
MSVARPRIGLLFFGRFVVVACVALATTVLLLSDPAPKVVHATALCGADTPSLINGSFEILPELPMSGSDILNADEREWRDFNGGNPPEMFLMVVDSVSADRIVGWQTTASDNIIEIQRQVPGYAHDGTGSNGTVSYGSYINEKGPQPGDGLYWAELNAYQASALYQDVSVTAGETYYWELLHRGRTFRNDSAGQLSPDKMKVKIGPIGSLVEQTSITRFAPTNADVYSGSPTYAVTGTSVSTIETTLDDGWTKYQGAYTALATGILRFQFESDGVGSQYAAVGNFLDGISFSTFEACDAARTIQEGDTLTLDMEDPEFVKGDGIAVRSVTVRSGNSGTVSSSGSEIDFTGTAGGVTVVDYVVEAVRAGQVVTRAATLTYTVSPAPTTTTSATTTTTTSTAVPAVVGDSTTGVDDSVVKIRDGLPSTGASTAVSSAPLAIVLMLLGLVAIVIRRHVTESH